LPEETINLNAIIAEANALEAVTRQLEDFTGTNTNQEINKLETTQKNIKTKCSRCGSINHSAEDKRCPAQAKKCLKCGYIGHFRKSYRTTRKPYERPKPREFKSNAKVNNTRYIDNDEYVFHIDDDDSLITVTVGEISIELLIDSGSKCNLLTDRTWEKLKNKKVQVHSQIKNPDKVLPYGHAIWENTTSKSDRVLRGRYNYKQNHGEIYILRDKKWNKGSFRQDYC